ncbi:MAG: acyl carrier protein [Lachnospiraceae bacterium]|nr:acyl carrier protein [Lachnospiraceae bacterium]
MDTTFEKLKKAIVEIVDFKEEDITPETKFVEDLGFNSFELMTFLGLLEERFQIRIDTDEVLSMLSDDGKALNTVSDAIKMLEKKEMCR